MKKKPSKRGRKTIEDKKVGFSIYVKQSVIDSYGGMDAFRNHIYVTYEKVKGE